MQRFQFFIQVFEPCLQPRCLPRRANSPLIEARGLWTKSRKDEKKEDGSGSEVEVEEEVGVGDVVDILGEESCLEVEVGFGRLRRRSRRKMERLWEVERNGWRIVVLFGWRGGLGLLVVNECMSHSLVYSLRSWIYTLQTEY
jgi:hypothetical protein